MARMDALRELDRDRMQLPSGLVNASRGRGHRPLDANRIGMAGQPCASFDTHLPKVAYWALNVVALALICV